MDKHDKEVQDHNKQVNFYNEERKNVKKKEQELETEI